MSMSLDSSVVVGCMIKSSVVELYVLVEVVVIEVVFVPLLKLW